MNKNKPQTLIEIWGIYLNLRAYAITRLLLLNLRYDLVVH